MFAVAAAGCGSKKDQPAANQLSAQSPLGVPVAKISKSSIADSYEATGTVRAKTTTQVSANMMGRITSLPFSEGDYVSRGQTLAEIDNRESRAQIRKAEAGLSEARAAITEIDKNVVVGQAAVRTAEANRVLAEQTFNRYRELFERKSASAQEFDEAQSKLKAATSEVDRAKASIQALLAKKQQINARMDQAKADIASGQIYEGYGKISSPVSGVIVKKFAESGAIASPGVPLLSIEDSSQYRLEAAVDESRSSLVRIGNRVSVRIDAIGDAEFFGIVSEVLPSSDTATRTLTVKIDLPANQLLRSGLFGVARFPVEGREAIQLAESAIVRRGQLTGIYVVAQDGTAQFRIVTTGKTSDGMIEILSGVADGDEYVAADVFRVTDGARVR